MTKVNFFLLCLLIGLPFAIPLCSASESLRQDIESPTRDSSLPSFETPVGLGVNMGTASGNPNYGAVVEGENHFNQRRGQYGLRQYGEGEARLEAGNGVGITLSAISGVTLFGLNDERRYFSPHLGIELFNGTITWSSNSDRSSYYEWIPMASAGFQFAMGSCRFLPLMRGGGAAGNIGKSGLVPALGLSYGAGTFVDCSGFDLSAIASRIQTQGHDVDLGTIDLAYSFSSNGLKIGLRGERELGRANESSAVPLSSPQIGDHLENRVLLLMRSRLSY